MVSKQMSRRRKMSDLAKESSLSHIPNRIQWGKEPAEAE
jgi:hypothetical protein